jgi:hypothetical protein
MGEKYGMNRRYIHLGGRSEGKKQLGRPRPRLKDNIETDLIETVPEVTG